MRQTRSNIVLAAILIITAAISKVITYPHTFNPIIGMALFSGAIITDKKYAFALPIFAMILSDILLEVSGVNGFYGWGQLVNYGLLLLITLVGSRLKRINVINVAGFSLLSSIIFYAVSNLGFFLIDNQVYHLYPNTLAGLMDCYVQAFPFLKWHVDLIFSAVLFGSYYLINMAASKRIAA